MLGGVDKAYSFEGYTLDLRRGFLSRGECQIELRPKSFAVLHFLIENAGRLVSKDEIVQAIWPSVAVTDESLARCISDVRLALADGEQRIIKTVPRRGYLFAAPFSEGSVSGESLRPMAQSTGQQGQAGEGAEARRSAERRQITVMVCDVVGLAALSMRLDPEDLRAVTAACHRHCAEVVRQHRGYVSHYSRGGILVYFGYPDAHENDAEDAIRAGLALVESGRMLATAHGSELRLRIGIASGLVVMGNELATGEATEHIAVGETPTLASLLQGAAEAGTVVISPITRRLVGNLFEYRDLGWVELNGLPQPVRAWQVLAPSTIESRFEALGTGLIPLVGRDEEIELLMRRWEQAKCGYGSVVMITGEPGIGKSRLAQTLQERIAAESHTRLRYFCSPHHQDSMLYPGITQLERAAGFRREDGPEQRLAKLETVLAQAANELAEVVPLIAALLSIPTSDPPLDLTPQKRKEKTLRALLSQVEGLAARQPVLIVFEGLHWSDPTTRESLDMLIDRLPSLRVLLVLTFRPEFAPPWVGRAHATLLSLRRLAPQQSEEMIAGVTGGQLLSEDITQEIIDRADGVPLFIEELTKAVIESGAIGDTGAPVRPQIEIPTSLHSSLLARLDRLGKARDVAQIGAAIGRHFTHELISAVADRQPAQVDDALAQLVRAELIFCRGTPPDAHYTFKHALVRDAAYACLLREKRREVHARIASILESRFPELSAAEPQLIALHCAEAGLKEKAADYWLKAGQKALSKAAAAEAIAHLTKGLTEIAALPSTPALRHSEINLQITLGNALIASRGHSAPEVATAFESARMLIERAQGLGDPPSDPLQRFAVMYGLWVINYVAGKGKDMLDRATACLTAAEAACLTAAEAQNITGARQVAHRIVGSSLLVLGELSSALSHLEQAVSLYEPDVHIPLRARFAQDIGVAALIGRAWTLSLLGYPDRALRDGETALAMAENLRYMPTTAYALCHLAMFPELMCGRIAAAERHSRELMYLSDQFGFPFWSALGMLAYGGTLTQSNRMQEGIDFIQRGLSAYSATGSGSFVASVLFICLIAEAHSKEGNLSKARGAIQEAFATIDATGVTWAEAEVHRVDGQLEQCGPKPDVQRAEACFRRSISVARCQNAKLWELRTSTSLAHLWRDQGKRVEAHNLLAPIYGWFTEGFDTPDLMEARALLYDLASG